MNARRILILLLMWLIPLYPVVAGAALHQPSSAHDAVAMSHAEHGQMVHDCCDTAQADDSLSNLGDCDAGKCISHCAVSLLDEPEVTPAQIAFVHAPPGITPLCSITLTPPSRPPSLL